MALDRDSEPVRNPYLMNSIIPTDSSGPDVDGCMFHVFDASPQSNRKQAGEILGSYARQRMTFGWDESISRTLFVRRKLMRNMVPE